MVPTRFGQVRSEPLRYAIGCLELRSLRHLKVGINGSHLSLFLSVSVFCPQLALSFHVHTESDLKRLPNKLWDGLTYGVLNARNWLWMTFVSAYGALIPPTSIRCPLRGLDDNEMHNEEAVNIFISVRSVLIPSYRDEVMEHVANMRYPPTRPWDRRGSEHGLCEGLQITYTRAIASTKLHQFHRLLAKAISCGLNCRPSKAGGRRECRSICSIYLRPEPSLAYLNTALLSIHTASDMQKRFSTPLGRKITPVNTSITRKLEYLFANGSRGKASEGSCCFLLLIATETERWKVAEREKKGSVRNDEKWFRSGRHRLPSICANGDNKKWYILERSYLLSIRRNPWEPVFTVKD